MQAMFLLPNFPHQNSGSAMWSMTPDMRRLAAASIVADCVSEKQAVALYVSTDTSLTNKVLA